MKRLFTILILTALLCGCQGDFVPVYEAPQSLETAPTSAQPLATQSDKSLPLPSGKQMLRLRRNFFSQTRYEISSGVLRWHDTALDRWIPFCDKTDCNHADEACFARFGDDDTTRFFAVRDKIVYCVETDLITGLRFFALNSKTGERMTYHKVAPAEGKSVILADAAIYESRAILNYDILTEGESEKMHYVLAFDLHSGSTVKVMERPILAGEIYDLWGMTEDHIIMAYLHAGGNEPFSNSYYSDAWYGEDYSAFIRQHYRWVLLEYPIVENTKWSKQLGESTASSDLSLYSYGNFYNGTLYYTVNDTLKAYDLVDHSMTHGFKQEGIVNMSCFDGKIFFKTSANEYFYHDLETQASVKYAVDAQEVYFPFAESEDELFCYRVGESETNKYSGVYYAIAKEAFYAQDFASAQCIQ